MKTLKGVLKHLHKEGRNTTALIRDGGCGYFCSIEPSLVSTADKLLNEVVEAEVRYGNHIVALSGKIYTEEGYVPAVKVETLRNFRD